jgi:hypothetical protein
MIATLIAYAKSLLRGPDHRLFIYGSAAEETSTARDVDLLMVIRASGEAVCHTKWLAEGQPCNLYVVPESVLVNDVCTLSHGGYYAHKLSLSFREISGTGELLDPAKFFWLYQSTRAEQLLGHPLEGDCLVRWVHAEILLQRPTYLRPLAKFVVSSSRRTSLRRWVEQLPPNKQTRDIVKPVSPTEYSAMGERALWRFWREYNRHKGGYAAWSPEAISKMHSSLHSDDIDVVMAYLGWTR